MYLKLNNVMLRTEIEDWGKLVDILSALVVPKPRVLDIRDFYTEELDLLVTTSIQCKRNGKPNTIIGIADCFMSSVKDIFVYALKEDRFEILELLDNVVLCQMTIFAGYAEIYVQEEAVRKEVHRTLCIMESFYDEFKVKQLNKYGYE